MKKSFVFAFFTFTLTILASGLLSANGQTISGSVANGTVARGSSARARVTMTIPGGLHVNSNRPNSQYAIPTAVRVSGVGVQVGAVSYPRGRNRKFAFSENTINVYEGRVNFSFNVSVPANFKGDTVRIRATVKYQACTEEVCYPPKSKEVTLTARVR